MCFEFTLFNLFKINKNIKFLFSLCRIPILKGHKQKQIFKVRHSCLSASESLCCCGSGSIIVSLTFCVCVFVFHSVHLNDGCLKETGVFASASLAYCRWAHKVVQPASWETPVPELSAGLETHRLVCRTLSFFSFAPSAVRQCLLALVLWYQIYSTGTVVCVVSALDCTAPHSLVSRHWNRQTFLCGWGWVDLLLMWAAESIVCSPCRA